MFQRLFWGFWEDMICLARRTMWESGFCRSRTKRGWVDMPSRSKKAERFGLIWPVREIRRTPGQPILCDETMGIAMQWECEARNGGDCVEVRSNKDAEMGAWERMSKRDGQFIRLWRPAIDTGAHVSRRLTEFFVCDALTQLGFVSQP